MWILSQRGSPLECSSRVLICRILDLLNALGAPSNVRILVLHLGSRCIIITIFLRGNKTLWSQFYWGENHTYWRKFAAYFIDNCSNPLKYQHSLFQNHELTLTTSSWTVAWFAAIVFSSVACSRRWANSGASPHWKCNVYGWLPFSGHLTKPPTMRYLGRDFPMTPPIAPPVATAMRTKVSFSLF